MQLLILSDIHANWPALRAVLAAEPDADEILCLGDLLDYGPEPLRCVEWAIDHVPPRRLLQGNHDWAVGWDEDPKCSPPYRHLAEVTRKHCLRVLTEGLRSFLCELWPQRSFSVDGASCFACHAVPSDPLF
ncbi:MAG: metallophosphoesterase family protein, partial [Rhodanobacteraceae bacterium]